MRKIICSMIIASLLVVSLVGCSISSNRSNGNYAYDGDKIDARFLEGNQRFTFDIFKELNREDQNQSIFISPFSISTALSMTYQGAGGATKEGMAEALNYIGIEMETLNDSYRKLLAYLENIDDQVQLNISNSIWAREGGGFNEDFLDVNKDVFDAYVTELDFSRADAADIINTWIEDATEGKIDKMLQPPIPGNVVMYLINAIYFKGEWTEKFDENRSFEGSFHTEEGQIRDITMMSRNETTEYGEGDGFKVVRLPYGNGKTAMYSILPDENTSINDFIEAMDADKWREIRESISEEEDVVLRIPRFKIEYGIKTLTDSLIQLGMGEAFNEKADFSNIRPGIFIEDVLHKAVIDVNEEGSEAAAATVVIMAESAVMDPTTFIADRPFLFIIADDASDTILFIGKLFDIH
ncbi:serpin B [Natronincola peptidivorans]|uniref:Serpin B n=1 Tax=Natronincola peptidivorans TaxID=426128 RepID=A0A1I0G4B9_9FIRM|nr:serpin family protein [Natronincola peptidivorans]SET64748.1 serpin B [Natronincola peptidivorans]